MKTSRFLKTMALLMATMLYGFCAGQDLPWWVSLFGLLLGHVFYVFVKGEARWTR